MEGDEKRESKEPVRVLELFSGIGGMHYALRKASENLPSFNYKVVMAVDISEVANKVRPFCLPTRRQR